MSLTDTEIRNAKPADKVTRLFDGRGLYLEIATNGGKWWRFKYRIDGKEKRLSLGTYPDISLKDARAIRQHRSLSMKTRDRRLYKSDHLATLNSVTSITT